MTVSRRTFVLGAAAAGFAPAAAPDWEKLRKRLTGPLLLPADAGYPQAKLGYFKLYDTQRPAAIARCARVEDVQACVQHAAAHRNPIAARSGGHSYAGYSTRDNGLIVDLGRLNTIEVSQDQATIGAGAQLIDIYEALAKAGRMLPGGTAPAIGIGGLTLGGGIGLLTRKYGLTCDRLVSARIVTADGRLRTVSAAAEPDLFWALRGGGGGNFGIVTSFTFRTEPATDLTQFLLEFSDAPAVIRAWQEWPVPDEVCSAIDIQGGTDQTTYVSGCYVGPQPGIQAYLDDLVRRVGSNPVQRYTQQRSYLDTMRYFAGCADLTPKECHPNWTGEGGELDRASYVATSRMLTKPVADPASFIALLKSSPGLYTVIESLGGAVARIKETDTAFPHRRALASIQITHTTEDVQAARRTIGRVRDELGREFGPTGYVNYIDPSMPNWQQAYYGVNLPKLQAIAKRYDPGRVFAFPQGLS